MGGENSGDDVGKSGDIVWVYPKVDDPPPNFNWFLHVMLFYHSRSVIKQQVSKARKKERQGVNDNEDSDTEDDNE